MTLRWCERSSVYYLFDGGWKKPKTGDEVLMSMKITKVDGSVDENNGLKYTVGDKSLGFVSTAMIKPWAAC